MAEHHAYLALMLGLDGLGYDVVHNNCLHYLPVAMAGVAADADADHPALAADPVAGERDRRPARRPVARTGSRSPAPTPAPGRTSAGPAG